LIQKRLIVDLFVKQDKEWQVSIKMSGGVAELANLFVIQLHKGFYLVLLKSSNERYSDLSKLWTDKYC
jgi:hypothetical protein